MIVKRNGAKAAYFPELRGSIKSVRFPCFAEVKYDGEATLIAYKPSLPTAGKPDIFTSNKYGTQRYDWSKLDVIAEILDGHDVEEAVLLAELYHGEGKANALYELMKNKDSNDLNLTIFDIGYLKTSTMKMEAEVTPLVDRKEILGNLFKGTPFLPYLRIVNNGIEANKYFGDTVAEGYEGIVVKSLDGFLVHGPCNWVKMKVKDRTIYPVITVDPTRERIEVAVPNLPVMGVVTPRVAVGVKVVNRYKKNINVGDHVEIEHQGVLASGSLRHPVFIRKIGGKE